MKRLHHQKVLLWKHCLKRLLQMEAENGSLQLVSTIGFEGRPLYLCAINMQMSCIAVASSKPMWSALSCTTACIYSLQSSLRPYRQYPRGIGSPPRWPAYHLPPWLHLDREGCLLSETDLPFRAHGQHLLPGLLLLGGLPCLRAGHAHGVQG